MNAIFYAASQDVLPCHELLCWWWPNTATIIEPICWEVLEQFPCTLRYMYLAQLMEDDPVEGERLLRQGVALLRAEAATAAADVAASAKFGNSEAAAESQAMQIRLCSALCSLGEQQMFIADDPLPETVAEAVAVLLSEAQAANPLSPEPGQALASLRYEQGRPDEALSALRQSMSRWFRLEDNEEEEAGTTGRDEDGGEDSRGGSAGPTAMDTDAAGSSGRTSGLGGNCSNRAIGRAGGAGGRGGEARMDDEEDRVDDDSSSSSRDDGEEDDERGDMEESEEEDEQDGPSLEFRFECAKLLLELDETSVVAVQVCGLAGSSSLCGNSCCANVGLRDRACTSPDCHIQTLL